MQNTFLKFLLSSFLGIACLSGARGDVLSVVFTGRYSLSGSVWKTLFSLDEYV
jgi:TctA family transporter